MWFTLSPAKIVKQQHANHASQHQQPTGPAKINALFLSPHLRFLRQMLLPNMRPVRNKRSCAKPPTRRQQWKNAIAKSVLILACGSYGLVASANDSSREGSTIYSFNIPAVKVEQALSQLAETTGHQLLFSYALVNSLQSTAVKGDHTAPNALQLMLQKTPLTARFTERGVIVITDASAGDNTDKGRGNMNSKTTLTKRKNVLAAMVGLFAAAGGASSAMAQGDEAATAQGRIDEIIVTAQKREQNVRDVPISIKAITGAELDDRGISNLEDLGLAIPGLTVQDNGFLRSVSIRGINNVNGTSPLTGFYIDEMPATGGESGFQLDLPDLRPYDLERVEVLKGPQGTLYGQGSMGGTVKYITKAPNLSELKVGADLQIAFTKDGDPSEKLRSVLNIPLIDEELALRLAISADNRGGWIDQPIADANDVNDSNVTNVRAKTLWKPREELAVSFMAIVHRNDAGAIGQGEDKNHEMEIPFGLPITPSLSEKYEMLNLTLTYNLTFAELLSSTSYTDTRTDVKYFFTNFEPFDLDFLYPIYSTDAEVINQELRLSSIGDKRLKWTLGATYKDVSSDLSNLTLLGSIGGPPPAIEDGFSDHLTSESEAWAIFGNASYEITDKVEFGLGVRYFEDERKFIDTSGTLQEGDFDSVSPRIYLNYDVTEDTMVYVSAAKGFRSGGFNALNQPSYEPESLWTYELGTKASFHDDILYAEASIYFTEYEGYLVRGILPPPAPSLAIFGNVGDVELKGVDLALVWHLNERTTVFFDANYVDAEVITVASAVSAQSVGDQLDGIPKYNYSVSLNRNFQVQGRPAFFRVDYNEQGKSKLTNRLFGIFGESDVINMLNVNLGWDWNEQVSVSIFGKNIADESGLIDPLAPFGAAVRPRPPTYGFAVSFEF